MSDAAPPPSLTKKERGRLKKLLHLASADRGGGGGGGGGRGTGIRTGIVSAADRDELAGLLNRSERRAVDGGPRLGPSVLPRRGGGRLDPAKWQSTSGADHRDVIASILFHDGGGPEQPQGPGDVAPHPSVVVPSLPGWVRLHNSAFATGLVVVEFTIDLPPSPDRAEPVGGGLMPSARVWAAAGDEGGGGAGSVAALLGARGLHGRGAHPFRVLMGEPHRPRSATDSLLYLAAAAVPVPAPAAYPDPDPGADPAAITEAMEELVIERKVRKREGYPYRRKGKKDRQPKKGAPPSSKRPRTGGEDSEDLAREEVASAAADLPASLLAGAGGGAPDPFSRAFSTDGTASLVGRLAVPGGDLGAKPPIRPVEAFVETFLPPASSGGGCAPCVYAVDCEMVESAVGSELARATLIRFEPTGSDPEGYAVVFDVLVRPARPVLDYKTKYSGVTATMLEGVTTRIEAVQLAVVSIVRRDDILVGHSLENDLRALRVVHERVIDTALLFRSGGEGGSRPRKHALRHLSASLLKRQIQQGGSSGHCSEEDAAAALILAVRRARIGPSFALRDPSRPRNIFDEVARVREGSNSAVSIASTDAPIVALGCDDWLKRHVTSHTNGAHALRCDSIASAKTGALVAWLTTERRRANILWANLAVIDPDLEASNSMIDKFVDDLVRQAPTSTAILLVFQRGYENSLRMNRQRKAASDSRATVGWNSTQEDRWKAVAEACAMSEAFWVGNI